MRLLFCHFLLYATALSGSFKADIRADTNRDGIVDIDGDSDNINKTTWTESHGAIFLANIGDSGKRCSKLAAKEDLGFKVLSACNDASGDIQYAPQYLAPVMTVPIADAPADAVGSISLTDPEAREQVRIFRQRADDWIIVRENDKIVSDELRAGLRLGIDARDVRRPDEWDGRATVRFTVQTGQSNSTDDVMLRVAPLLTHSHVQDVEQVISTTGSCKVNPAQAKFNSDLAPIVSGAGIDNPIVELDTYDVWAQDFFEPAYMSMPGPNDTSISIRIMARSAQKRTAGRTVFTDLRKTGWGAVQESGLMKRFRSIDSTGNHETIPPYTFGGKAFPAGRIVLGAHGPQKPLLTPFWQAQETQNPLMLDTDWLLVGHIDEFMQFLPVESERGWVIMADDPRAGIQLLRQAIADGHGSTRFFSRTNSTVNSDCEACVKRNWYCNPNWVPKDTIEDGLTKNLTAVNEKCSERIEANLELLKAATGITDAEIHRIPAIFEAGDMSFPLRSENPSNINAMAMIPGIINGLVLTGTGTVVPPNPWGPVINGKDIFATAAVAAYEKLNISVKFLDDWNSHHVGVGEVHCGTNSIRDMSRPWWKIDSSNT